MQTRSTIWITDSCIHIATYDCARGEPTRSFYDHFEAGYPHLPQQEDDLLPLARQIIEKLKAHDLTDNSFTLVVPSNWCFSHLVPDATKRTHAQSAVYEFEQYTPKELEKLSCVTTSFDAQSQLVVAVVAQPLTAFLAEFENQHIDIESMTIDLAIASDYLGRQDETRGVILLDDTRLGISTSQDTGSHGIFRTVLIRPDEDIEKACIKQLQFSVLTTNHQNDHWHMLPLNDRARSAINSANINDNFIIDQRSKAQVMDDLLRSTVTSDLALDLRRGALDFSGRWKTWHGRVRAVLYSVAILIFVLAGLNMLQQSRYAAANAALQKVSSKLYGQAFEGKSPKPGATRLVHSERVRLEGLTQTIVSSNNAIARQSGLDSLVYLSEIVKQVPSKIKIAIKDITTDERGMRLIGNAKDHHSAGSIVQALNQLDGTHVEPPKTKQLSDNTVEFRIQIQREAKDGT